MYFLFDSLLSFIDELKKSISKENLDYAFMSSELYFANSDLAIFLSPEEVKYSSEENIHIKKNK